MMLETLAAAWLELKEQERAATEARREIEDKMAALLNIQADLEGTKSAQTPDGYKIKVTCRIDRKVDAELAQEIAVEHGLSAHLSSLFRWRPEINMALWKAADENITRPLLAAITSKPGRPSFSITKEGN